MDNYSPLDPLRNAGTAHSDSRPHSSLLDAFSGDPLGEEGPTPKGIASFGANCPAVFVVPMGRPVRQTKQDTMSSTLGSGIAGLTRQAKEDEVTGSWDTTNDAPMIFYSHRDSAIGGEHGADLLNTDPISSPSHDSAVEGHYEASGIRAGGEKEGGTGRVARTVPVQGAEEDTDNSGDVHGNLEGWFIQQCSSYMMCVCGGGGHSGICGTQLVLNKYYGITTCLLFLVHM